ncbi:hypothetical protein BDV38DRAFT_106999 [Aspergillus pseudotamarii]|uniref:Uncharacterized protein n=1 Tax=Aspergillus pseudotamarii TaxID=132259 RepID=A0A5N6SQI1_ASPPS|nr:uncharacterized protein BDV38DRAFT_106999 [Aspergillus pseudotamarii]KAE8136948.1 hypothetical protein BDV38DRAFT_106999 [Aspergillus pseudotamarii]
MARTTLSFYAVCFILALTGSALPARRADASSSASAVAPSGTANFVYDAVKSVTHMAQDMNKEFSDDDETPKPTPIDTHPVPPKPSSSETATKSLKDDYEEQTAQKVHDLEEPSSSPKPKANAQTEPPTEERPTEERKESEPAPTPTPTKQQPASSSSAAPAASSSVHKDDAITKLPVVGPILGKVL